MPRIATLATTIALGALPLWAGDTMLFDDLDAFIGTVESTAAAGFDDLPVGTGSPFVSDGVAFTSSNIFVMDELYGW